MTPIHHIPAPASSPVARIDGGEAHHHSRPAVTSFGAAQKLRVLDLFSGIGGFSLGLERTGGFETVAFCEIEEFPRRVLAKHWPEVPCYHDVTKLTGDILAGDGIAVDVITGGFPCQDISCAGKQAGIKDGTRSGLWSEIVRLIGELRPRYVIVENVANLLSGPSEKRGGWFGRILGDLAECGYDAEWENIPASALGAPHRRERVWIVANPIKRLREGSILPNKRNVPIFPDWEGAGEVYSLFFRGRGGPVGDRRSLRDDAGFPAQLDRIAAAGNAVVPQIPELIGKSILAAEFGAVAGSSSQMADAIHGASLFVGDGLTGASMVPTPQTPGALTECATSVTSAGGHLA